LKAESFAATYPLNCSDMVQCCWRLPHTVRRGTCAIRESTSYIQIHTYIYIWNCRENSTTTLREWLQSWPYECHSQSVRLSASLQIAVTSLPLLRTDFISSWQWV
jgi:hypothetical protein